MVTMSAQSDTQRFVEELQTYSHRRLNFPENLAEILDLAGAQRMEEVFRDVIFHAKFAMKTKEIMARIGREGEGYNKLSSEFQNSIEKTSALLKTIVKESPEGIKQHIVGNFFTMDQESFGKFLRFLEDLSWVKNWEVDGRPLPFSAGLDGKPDRTRSERMPKERTVKHSTDVVGRIRNGAILGFILMTLMSFVDPPVTVFGWSLAIIVALLLLSIAFVSHALTKKSSSIN